MDKIRLLIVGEDYSVLRGLSAIFASEKTFEVLGCFPLKETREKSTMFQPDAVLADINHDIDSYIHEISRLRKECPCSLLIAMVENKQSEEVIKLLAQGVDSCLPRGIMRGYLVKIVELACRTGVSILPSPLKKMVSYNNTGGSAGKLSFTVQFPNGFNGSGKALTRREMEILELMAKNLSNREISKKLFISVPTVKTHVSSILRKLGQRNRAQAIVYSYKTGLVKNPIVINK